MLERQVTPPDRTPRVALAIGAALGLGTIVAMALARPAPPAATPAILFVATAPAPAIAPAPLAVALPPAPIHVGCTDLADTTGTPEPITTGSREHGAPLDAVIVGDDGCAIAIRVGATLHVSWDGGASFTTIDMTDGGESPAMSFARGRLLWLQPKRHALGVLEAGARDMRWIDLAPLHFTAEQYPAVVNEHGWLALSNDKSWFASHDDGKTWIALAAPVLAKPKGEVGPAWITGVDADGTVRAEIKDDLDAGEGGGGPDDRIEIHEYEAPAAIGTWHEVPSRAVPPVRVHGWSYTMIMDQYWGCGGTQAIVASHGKTTVTIAGHLSWNWGHIGVVSGNGHAYAQHTSVIYELVGATATPIRGVPGPEPALSDDGEELLAIDPAGGLLVHDQDRVLRWTKLGGWRVLFSTEVH